MQIGNITIDFAGLAALIISIYTLVKGIQSRKRKAAASDAEASEKYAKVAGLSAEQLARKIEEIDTLRGEMSLMKDGFDKEKRLWRKKFDAQAEVLTEWRFGIGRLIHQIGMHGEKPVWEPDYTKLDKLNHIQDENETK